MDGLQNKETYSIFLRLPSGDPLMIFPPFNLLMSYLQPSGDPQIIPPCTCSLSTLRNMASRDMIDLSTFFCTTWKTVTDS